MNTQPERGVVSLIVLAIALVAIVAAGTVYYWQNRPTLKDDIGGYVPTGDVTPTPSPAISPLPTPTISGPAY